MISPFRAISAAALGARNFFPGPTSSTRASQTGETALIIKAAINVE